MATVEIAAELQIGEVIGEIVLPHTAISAAACLAAKHFQEAQASEFCGDAVEDYLPPAWMSSRWTWYPFERVSELGFHPASLHAGTVYATVGVEPHEDDMNGPCFILCLFNDGLRFSAGAVEHETAVGQWFILDDFETHAVIETESSTTYLIWSVPLKRIGCNPIRRAIEDNLGEV